PRKKVWGRARHWSARSKKRRLLCRRKRSERARAETTKAGASGSGGAPPRRSIASSARQEHRLSQKVSRTISVVASGAVGSQLRGRGRAGRENSKPPAGPPADSA